MVDGDKHKRKLWPELTFSTRDRQESIRRLGYIASRLNRHKLIVLLAAINPYESIRNKLKSMNPVTKGIYINTGLETLQQRDTKELYSRALLPW